MKNEQCKACKNKKHPFDRCPYAVKTEDFCGLHRKGRKIFTFPQERFFKKDLYSSAEILKFYNILKEHNKTTSFLELIQLAKQSNQVLLMKGYLYLKERARKTFSKYWKTKRSCLNTTCPFTYESINIIEPKMFCLVVQNNKKFGFHIFYLYKYLKITPKNPFTQEKFSQTNLTKINKQFYLVNLFHHYTCKEEKITLLESIINLFGKIPNNYRPDPKWFYELTVLKLSKFIRYGRRVWRTSHNLDDDVCRELLPLKNGYLFKFSIHNKSHLEIKRLILLDFEEIFGKPEHLILASILLLKILSSVNAQCRHAYSWIADV